MAVRAIFFDFVGTLAFVDPDVGTVYADVARTFGLDLDPSALDRAFAEVFPRRPPLAFPRDLSDDARRAAESAWWRAVVADTLRACGVPLPEDPRPATGDRGSQSPSLADHLSSILHPASRVPLPIPNTRHETHTAVFAFESYFAALYETFATPAVWRLDPAALGVLKTLHEKGIRTGVVSNFDGRLPVLLDRLGLGPWLDVVVYSSAVGAAKPEADIFLEACRQAGVAPAEALHVGDDPELDYRGARRAGLHACWRVHPVTPRVPDIPAADCLRDLTAVVDLVSKAR